MSDLNLAIKLTTQGGKVVVKDLQQIEAVTGKVNHSLNNTAKSGAVAGQGLDKASTGANALTGSLKGMLAQAAGVIALGVGIDKIASGMYQGIDAFQGYRGQLKTITGDFDSASKELDRLIQLSKETPFTLKQSVEGFAKLTNLGLEPSRKSMISYGNTAAAMGKDLMQMIEAVADASTNEFERLKEFGIKAKQQGDKVTFTFRGVATTVKKDAASIQQYLINLGNTQFAGAMDDQMGRLSSRSSNLQTSIAQLYDEIGRAGVENSFGSAIDNMASSIDDLTKHVPELIGLLSTLTNIVMIGGSLYLGMKSIPILMGYAATTSKLLATNILATSMAYKAGITPLALFSGGLKASTAATKAAIVQNGLLRSSVQLLFAAYAGWEFGTYLRKQFVEVRVAGLAFVGAMETGFVNLSYAFSAVAPKAKQIWGELTSWLQNKLGALYNLIGDGLAKIGAGDMAQNYHAFAQSLAGSSDAAKSAKQELTKLEEQRKRDIALVDKTIISLIQHEYALKNNTKSTKLNTKKKTKNTAATVKELTTNQKLIVSLGKELAMSQLTAKQKLLNSNLSKLSADATQAERDQIIALTEELIKQQQLQDDSTYYDNIINGANDIGEAWGSAGNVIVDTFGSIGQQLNKLAQQQEKYAEQQKKIAKDKLKYADNPKELAKIGKAEEKLAQTRTSANLSSYAAISGAASKMFSENSKARKAMHAMEQVFTVAEVALATQRAIANAIASIANQGNGDPYSAFARIAAMAAIMAGLGIAVSGGSGSAPTSAATRQQNQGTGTVLGSDDKSQSILNAFDRIESLELDQYAELRQMNSTLHDLNNNIAHLAVSLVRGYGKFDAKSYGGELGSKSTTTKFEELLLGGVLGQFAKALDPTGIIGKVFSSFSSKKRSLMDSGISIVSQTLGDIIDTGLLQAQAYFDIKTKKKSFWGLSSSTKYNTEYQSVDNQLQREFALIFTNIGDSINNAIDVLGISIATETTSTFEQVLAGFNGNIEDFDFSKVNFDQFFGGVTEQISEGATRSLDNFVIDLPNISFKDKTGEEIQKELEAVFSQQADLMTEYLVPQIAEFQQAGEGLYDTLIRVAQEQVIFNSVLELTAQSLAGIDANAQLDVAQSIIEFAGSIEALQSAANTYLNEFFTDAEQFDMLSSQLNDQFAALNVSLPDTRDGFKDLLGSLDLTKESDQRLYAALMLLIPQLDGYYDALEAQRKKAEQAAEAERKLAIARGEFVADISDQLARLDMSPLEVQLFNLQRQFEDYRDNAAELGADTALLEQLYAKKRQKILDDALAKVNETNQRALDQLANEHQRALDNLTRDHEQQMSNLLRDHQQKMNDLTQAHEQAVNDLVSNNDRLIASIASVSSNIGDSILTLKRSMQGWDEVSYQQGNVSKFRSKLGAGSIDEQLANIDALNTALFDKYQAELDHNRSMSDLAQQRYNNDLSNYKNLAQAAKNLKKAADDLRFGDLSTFTSTEQFGFAKDAFNQALASGDIANLQSTGKQYLTQAKNYYGGTASSEYQAIFDKVTSSFGNASAGAAPSIPAEIKQYQQADIALQNDLLAELESLQAMTDELDAQRAEQFDSTMADLIATYETESAALIETYETQSAALIASYENEMANLETAYNEGVAELAITLAEQTAEITNALGNIETAIGNIEPPKIILPPPPKFPPIIIINDPAPLPPDQIQKEDNSSKVAVASHEKLGELVDLTKQQNARLEALEMRQAELNSKNNKEQQIA